MGNCFEKVYQRICPKNPQAVNEGRNGQKYRESPANNNSPAKGNILESLHNNSHNELVQNRKAKTNSNDYRTQIPAPPPKASPTISIKVTLIDNSKQSFTVPRTLTIRQFKQHIYTNFQELRPQQFVLLQAQASQLDQTTLPSTQVLGSLGSGQLNLIQSKAELWETEGLKVDKDRVQEGTRARGVAYMSCGNYFSRQRMITIVRNQIRDGNSEIACPLCGSKWQLREIVMVAGYTATQRNKVSEELSRYLRLIRSNVYNYIRKENIQSNISKSQSSINYKIQNKLQRNIKTHGQKEKSKHIEKIIKKNITLKVKLTDNRTITIHPQPQDTVTNLKKQIFLQFTELLPEQTVLTLNNNNQPIAPSTVFSQMATSSALVLTQRKAELWETEGINTDKNKEDPISCERGVAVMSPPCGHQIGREAIKAYIQSELNTDQYQFLCPQLKQDGTVCRSLWGKKEWRLVAGYTQSQMNAIETRMSENMVKKNSKECRTCHHRITNIGLSTNRVKCPICPNAPDFCFACLEPWKGSDSKFCGNEVCRFKMQMVTNSPLERTFMMYTEPNTDQKFPVTTPKYRLCPRCKSNIIENYKDCPHTRCPCNSMQYTFCFVCLGIFDVNANTWPCGKMYEYCGKVAPNQTFD